jgi:PII-like signaling protein
VRAPSILGRAILRQRVARQQSCTGTTTFAGVESLGSDGRRHSAKFFELVDQPIEIMMAVTEQQATAPFRKDQNY